MPESKNTSNNTTQTLGFLALTMGDMDDSNFKMISSSESYMDLANHMPLMLNRLTHSVCCTMDHEDGSTMFITR
jgi:hypothetical protein